jgi:hypothetical protein
MDQEMTNLPPTWNDLPDSGIHGIGAPATTAARRAAEVCRQAAQPYLANHSARSYFWGAHLGALDGMEFDAELLWVAALMHDLGLTADAPADACFERVSADIAADVLRGQGWPSGRISVVTDAIVLHMELQMPAELSATARLLDAGVSLDVSGRRFDEVPPALREAVLAHYPRFDFKRRFEHRLDEVAAERPSCSTGPMLDEFGLRERIRNAPWRE